MAGLPQYPVILLGNSSNPRCSLPRDHLPRLNKICAFHLALSSSSLSLSMSSLGFPICHEDSGPRLQEVGPSPVFYHVDPDLNVVRFSIDPAAQNYDRVSVSCDAFAELNFNRDITFIFEPRTHESIGDSAVESTPESSPPRAESPPPVRHRLVRRAHLPRLSFFSSPSPPPEPDADIGPVGLATTDSPPPLRRPLPRRAHLPRLSLLPSPSPPPEPDADFSPLEPATTNSPPPLCSELAMPELVDAPPGSSLEDDSISQSSDSPPAYSRTPTPLRDFLAMFSDAPSPVHASSPPPWILDDTEAQVETLSEGEEQRSFKKQRIM